MGYKEMPNEKLKLYKGQQPSWCPGCGNFPILKALKDALVELDISPHEFTIVSGIGQAPKLPHYTKCHTFNGLHGRTLPVATGLRLTNHEMRVINITGDGDCYGEGGNHLIHAIRRNPDITHLVHNNQIYGLTKGQASPTTAEGTRTKNQPQGTGSEPLNPLAFAISLDASFVARGFAGDTKQLTALIKEAILHRGYAIIDILQPCVTFNKVNTYEWYRERVQEISNDHDPSDRVEAFRLSLEWGEKIPTGVIYKNPRHTIEDSFPVIKDAPLLKREFTRKRAVEIVQGMFDFRIN
jgi:2-oxoglutarate ferredoxin oxidoreductase subunit beta